MGITGLRKVPELAVKDPTQLTGYRCQRQAAFRRRDQSLAPEAMFDRHWIGLLEQFWNEPLQWLPNRAGTQVVVGRDTLRDVDEPIGCNVG
jgi:hypothetical protein